MVVGAVAFAHATCANRGEDFEGAELSPGLKRDLALKIRPTFLWPTFLRLSAR
jgi:hypothetical protein